METTNRQDVVAACQNFGLDPECYRWTLGTGEDDQKGAV